MFIRRMSWRGTSPGAGEGDCAGGWGGTRPCTDGADAAEDGGEGGGADRDDAGAGDHPKDTEDAQPAVAPASSSGTTVPKPTLGPPGAQMMLPSGQ